MRTGKLTFDQETTTPPPPPLTFFELWDACVDVSWHPYPIVVAMISGYRIGCQPLVYRLFSFGRSPDPRDFDTRDAAFTTSPTTTTSGSTSKGTTVTTIGTNTTGRLTGIRRTIDAQEWNPIHRSRLVAGLRELADYLESHPGLRCPYSICATAIAIAEREEDERAEVDHAGQLLNAPVRKDGHYTVERHFGPVSYAVIHIPDQWRHEHDQRASYRDNIIPNREG